GAAVGAGLREPRAAVAGFGRGALGRQRAHRLREGKRRRGRPVAEAEQAQLLAHLSLLAARLDRPQMLLRGDPHAILEVVPRETELTDLLLDPQALVPRLAHPALRGGPCLADDQIRLPPCLVLDLVGELADREEGLLDRSLPAAVFRDPAL